LQVVASVVVNAKANIALNNLFISPHGFV
jgi:hypothetical protein